MATQIRPSIRSCPVPACNVFQPLTGKSKREGSLHLGGAAAIDLAHLNRILSPSYPSLSQQLSLWLAVPQLFYITISLRQSPTFPLLSWVSSSNPRNLSLYVSSSPLFPASLPSPSVANPSYGSSALPLFQPLTRKRLPAGVASSWAIRLVIVPLFLSSKILPVFPVSNFLFFGCLCQILALLRGSSVFFFLLQNAPFSIHSFLGRICSVLYMTRCFSLSALLSDL